MPVLKFDSKITKPVERSTEDLVDQMYRRLGHRWVAVVELEATERTEVAEDETRAPAVRLRIVQAEIATGDAEHHVRDVMRALYTLRTGQGTLDDAATAEEMTVARNAIRYGADLINGGEE